MFEGGLNFLDSLQAKEHAFSFPLYLRIHVKTAYMGTFDQMTTALVV